MADRATEPSRAMLWGLFAAASRASGDTYSPDAHARFADELLARLENRFQWDELVGCWKRKQTTTDNKKETSE